MPKVSYEFTVPSDSYSGFRRDISDLAAKSGFLERVIFDDDGKRVLFNCDVNDLDRFFYTPLQETGKQDDYNFFCCHPSRYQNCKRLEDRNEVSFAGAHKASRENYEKLKRELAVSQQQVLVGDESIVGTVARGESVIIAEYHPDPAPKTKMLELIRFAKDLPVKPIVVLERLPQSQDDVLARWLKDGSIDSSIPISVRRCCEFVDAQNLKGIWPNAAESETAIVRHSMVDILLAAKASGVEVVFMESEQSTTSPNGSSSNGRHPNLVSAMDGIVKSNPGRSFVVLCGAFHNERSEEAEVVLSDVVPGALSCHVKSPLLCEKLDATAAIFESEGKSELAAMYRELAEKYKPADISPTKFSDLAKDRKGSIGSAILF